MNFPLGTLKIQGKNIKQWDPRLELEALAQQNFSGYVVGTLFNGHSVDECALLFRSGQVIGSIYELHLLAQSALGDAALPFVGNALACDQSVWDVSELSGQQVELITAFNSKLKLTKPLSKGQLKSLVKDAFDASALPQSISSPNQAASDSKESLFKKFGLVGIDQV